MSPASRLAAICLSVAISAACDSGSDSTAVELVSSRAYKGHANDLDMNRFVNTYKQTLGSRLDDCQTCHMGGTFTYDSGGWVRTTTRNACDFCHLIQHPDPTLVEAPPTSFVQTLNPYGLAYTNFGRSRDAFVAIADVDSDGDGATNQAEILDLKYPGDPNSKPGQLVAAMRTFTLDDLAAMPAHAELLLANTNKQQFDYYATYKGVTLANLLLAAGVDPTDRNITGVTVIAPDGYLKDVPPNNMNGTYPPGLFYAGLDTATLGSECGFVQYPDTLPAGLTDGGVIPGQQRLILAYERDGRAMDVCTLDDTTGRINGEGPLRLVVPQVTPGKPDRGSQYSPTACGDGNDYDDAKAHNAGDMVRGVIGIRINPLQAGVEDFDYRNGGWAYVDSRSVIVYGYGVTSSN
jgi:hypothetical protein